MDEFNLEKYRNYKQSLEKSINIVNNSSDVDKRLRGARNGVKTLEKMKPYIKKGEITLDQDVDEAIHNFKNVNDEIITEYLDENYSDIVEQDLNEKTDEDFFQDLKNLLTDTCYYRLLSFDRSKIQAFDEKIETVFKAISLPSLSKPAFSLLREFKFQGNPDDYTNSERWQDVLPDPEYTVKFFSEGDLIRPLTQIETIDLNLTKVEIQDVLRTHNKPVSGLKDELIKRALNIDENIFNDKLKEESIYKCTEKGLKLVKIFENYQQKLQKKVKEEILSQLENRQFRSCLELRKKFEDEKVFPSPPGMGTWSTFISSTLEQLQLIFSKRPTILKEISDDNLEKLRLGAGFLAIWGESKPDKDLISRELECKFDFDVACRMLLFHASHIQDLTRYEESNVVRKVEIIASNDSCDNCKKIDGKKFEIDKVPELPYPNCTCELGCRCTIAAVNVN